MNAAEFAALDDAAKARHAATLTKRQRVELIDQLVSHHKAKAGTDPDPFRLRLNQQFREWAAARSPQ